MEMLSAMTPTSDIPDNPLVPDPSPSQRDIHAAAGGGAADDAFTDEFPGLDDVDSLPADEAIPPESTVCDMPDESLTAEERLLDSIVGDPRVVASPDDVETSRWMPVDSAEAPRTEPEVEPFADAVPAPTAAGARVMDDSQERSQRLDDEVRSVRDELARVTADRDDLATRLDLAAVEFDRLNQEIDASALERSKLSATLSAAQDALATAQDALKEVQDEATKALQARDAAVGELESSRNVGQREQDRVLESLRQMQADDRYATQRRLRLFVAGAAAVAVLGVVGGYALGRVTSSGLGAWKNPSVTLPVALPPAAAAPVCTVPTNLVRRTNATATSSAWPSIRDPRMTVTEELGTLVVRFNQAVFVRGAEIQPAGRQDLRRLAAHLKPYATAYRVEVEGHADRTPAASGGSYASSHELGLLRARAAMELLAKEGGLPSSSLSISSAGDTNPPFPGDSAEARRRCRTVVVKLHHAKPVAP